MATICSVYIYVCMFVYGEILKRKQWKKANSRSQLVVPEYAFEWVWSYPDVSVPSVEGS